jgi:Phytanoyl-CoA dioxygenase (PhyH)
VATHEHPLNLGRDGATRYTRAMPRDELAGLLRFSDAVLDGQSGVRVFDRAEVCAVLGPGGSIGRCAAAILGTAARPVRAILFDKTADNNWAVPWHQDRTIAVRERRDVPGFGPWSVKAGVVHVEPPFDIIEDMITIRAHLDDCAEDNAPLLVVPGSHRLGRVTAERTAEVAREHGHAPCTAGAGDLWIYATSIVHASERALNPQRRRVLQVDYASGELPGGLEWLGVAGSV